jgi:alpha-glucuronidase
MLHRFITIMPVKEYDECWLRYEESGDRRESYHMYKNVYTSVGSPELGVIRDELRRGIEGLLGRTPHLWQHPPRSVDGFLAVGTPDEMEVISDSVSVKTVRSIDNGGFHIRSTQWKGADCVIVTAPTDRGLVYGTFHLLRLMATGQPIDDLTVVEEPTNAERIINHWDNPFRQSVERGYAGQSIFDWERLPDLRERYWEYARLLASIGINGIVLNNVNTRIPSRQSANAFIAEKAGWQLLESDGIEKTAALASVFRCYGIRTYLSVNYAAPMLIDDRTTADPIDSNVEAWWGQKADEIYDRIPDFGGFLVKADSEGQPGPYDYDRTHAEGANVLARAVEPHGGRVWWRAFVYSDHDDRAVQAYEAFEPLDGAFHDNVTVQIKNGPIDFQPREPVSSLFSVMTDTNIGCELQITQEYTGQGVHCSYLVPQWKEILECDTYANGEGSPVMDVLADSEGESEGEGIVGVANIGEDPNWTGHYLSQANLYGYGRLAWDPDLDSESITEEWVRLTFGDDPAVVETITDILLDSWEICIDYTTGGLGLMHMMYNGSARLENHYDPSPEEWPDYHGATEDGIGVDRTASGSGYTTQYPEPIADVFESPVQCPDELLLFFHHLPWEYELSDGTTIIQQLYDNCFDGVEEVRDLRDRWRSLNGDVDEQRYQHVAERFDEHVVQAERWCDTLVSFFYEYSQISDKKNRVPLSE